MPLLCHSQCVELDLSIEYLSVFIRINFVTQLAKFAHLRNTSHRARDNTLFVCGY